MQWRARIDGPDGRVLGAGTLVGDVHVLTCAHVVAGRSEVRVAFPGFREDLPATVELRGPWKDEGDTGDVAVLRLAAPAPHPGCSLAPLGSLRPGTAGAGGRAGEAAEFRLRSLGFPRGFEGGTHVTLRTSADRVLPAEWLQVDAESGHLQALDEGFSGAAAYFPADGKVAGMITDAAVEGGGWSGQSGRSGRMLPLEAVRAHWEGLDDHLPLTWLPDAPRRELRALLDGAATAEPLTSVFKHAFPAFLPGANDPLWRGLDERSVWNAVRYVGEQVTVADRVALFLAALREHLDARVRAELDAWTRGWTPSSAPPAAAPPEPASIIVTVRRRTKGPYELTLSTLIDGTHTRRTAPLPVRRNQIRPRVEKALPELLPFVHGRTWMIEFVVPEALLHEPFDDWLIREPGSPRPAPMRSVPVVVRDVQRLQVSMAAHHARRRWGVLHARGETRPEPVGCVPGHSYDEFYSRLDASEESCALAYASRPREASLAAALDTGIPIMLWRRVDCPGAAPAAGGVPAGGGAPHSGCDLARLRDELIASLAGQHPDRLPFEVMRLRKRARLAEGDGGHCGHRLTLFWDGPTRGPEPPLAMGRP